jgi:hypothetical protein
MSSPEYVELRGIPGTTVAAKAQLYTDPRKRSVLFFLHSLSVNENGLHLVARMLSPRFPTLSERALTGVLIELCINPKIALQFLEEPGVRSKVPRITDAVREFQESYERRVNSEFIFTSIGRETFETLDHALATGKMVVIEGESGSGKTTAAEAWCAAHQGQARFISLSGINHKTGFFRKLATAIGLSAAKSKAIDMQVRVEEFFRRTRLMLVIDEAHYLWPQYQRSYTSPELIDWVNTALVNHNVPVALICTDQFAKLKTRVEKETGWTSDQLEHRVRRYKKLSSVPTKQDLEAVASKLLSLRWSPEEQKWTTVGAPPHPDLIRVVVGYALTCKMRLAAIAKTVEEARCQARKAGRLHIIATDIRTAILEYQVPSDGALENAFQSNRFSVGSVVKPSIAAITQRPCKSYATSLQSSNAVRFDRQRAQEVAF